MPRVYPATLGSQQSLAPQNELRQQGYDLVKSTLAEGNAENKACPLGDPLHPIPEGVGAPPPPYVAPI